MEREKEEEEKKEPEQRNKSILWLATISVAVVCLFDSLFSLWLFCFLCGCICKYSKVRVLSSIVRLHTNISPIGILMYWMVQKFKLDYLVLFILI